MSGYADTTMKNISGKELFRQKISGNFWWDNTEYYGPKWGLYRRKDEIFDPKNYIFFQNVQIWKQEKSKQGNGHNSAQQEG
jgi:hypothetical protein